MPIPIEAGRFTYTPECYADLPGAPVFTLRHGTRRDKHLYQDAVRLKRLQSHSQQDFRDAVVDEIRQRWASDAMPIDEIVDAVQRYYSAADDFDAALAAWRKGLADMLEALPEAERADAVLPPSPEFEFDSAERTRVENLISDVERHSDRLGRMSRDNGRREREIRRIAISVLLEDTSLPIALKRDMDGLVDDEAIYAIEDALDDFSDAEDHRGGIAFAQLGTKALLSFFVTKEEEKNFSSPDATPSGASSSRASDNDDSTTATSESKVSDGLDTPEISSPSKTSA